MPCDLSLGYRTCAHESGESGSPAPGQKSRSAKSTSPRVRWSICRINVGDFIRFRPDLWPDSLTSPGVRESGDPHESTSPLANFLNTAVDDDGEEERKKLRKEKAEDQE